MAKEIEIITDVDIITLSTNYITFPPFKPLSLLGQLNLCNILGLQLVNEVFCKIKRNSSCTKDVNLNMLSPICYILYPR